MKTTHQWGSMRTILSILLVGPLAGCVELTTLAPPAQHVLPTAVNVASESEQVAFVGLELQEALSGSLEELEIQQGLDVARVTPGSPAESAGVKPGDRVMGADGAKLERLDEWQASLAHHVPGSTLVLDVERDGALRKVNLVVGTRGARDAGAAATATRFVERVKLRAVLDTIAADDGTSVAVVELLPQSPLGAEGVAPGDRIVAEEGEPITGASELIARITEREFGDTVRLQVLHDDERRDVTVTLWQPPRVLTGLGVPILFHFDRNLEADKTEFALIDLWVLALYDYRREGAARRHRILRFFRFETDTGRLTEEPTEPDRPAKAREAEPGS